MYREAIDRYALVHGFYDEALGDDDWKSIKIVAEWLRLFRKATTCMSAHDKTTISLVFAVFVSLQNHIRHQLRSLPRDVPVELKAGLVKAHEKLAEYFKKSDTSPYYMWAACKHALILINASN
jgi:predicted solute-binding protein